MSYDLIIVSQSTPALIPVTQRCIDSAREDMAELNIVVIETGQPYKYNVDKIIEYNGEFNYNRALNMGLKYAKNEIHILANNDLVFHPGWSKIGDLMKANGYHSASCATGDIKQGECLYEGYSIETILAGWCIFIDDYCLEKIGQLDETMSFWFSDNLYACQIKAAGIKHALFCNCRVDHLVSQTLRKQPSRIRRQYQIGEFRKFNERLRYYAQREITDKSYS
jgi:glycosyltransferase involved in cell wall biosynthesis